MLAARSAERVPGDFHGGSEWNDSSSGLARWGHDSLALDPSDSTGVCAGAADGSVWQLANANFEGCFESSDGCSLSSTVGGSW